MTSRYIADEMLYRIIAIKCLSRLWIFCYVWYGDGQLECRVTENSLKVLFLRAVKNPRVKEKLLKKAELPIAQLLQEAKGEEELQRRSAL
jgi:hypothetical protein